MPEKPEVKIVNIIERTELDEQGQFSTFFEIVWRVGDLGPFRMSYRKDPIDPDEVRNLVEERAERMLKLLE